MIDVIIPNLEHLDILKRCVGCVKNHLPDSNIIVVDSGSSREVFKYYHSENLMVTTVDRFTFGTAINRAVKLARHKYLLLLNNDCFINETIHHLIDLAERNPDYGCIGCRLCFENGNIQHAGMKWSGEYFVNRIEDRGRIEEIVGVTHALALIPRKVFEKVGGYDEEYIWGDAEDIDLCFKIREAGYKVIYTPLCTAIHLQATTRRQFPDNFSKAYYHNRERLLNKWKDKINKLKGG